MTSSFGDRSILALLERGARERASKTMHAPTSPKLRFAALVLGAFCGIGAGVHSTARGGTVAPAQRSLAFPAEIDRVIVRGRWRVHVGLGAPSLRYVASGSDSHAMLVSREATTLTIVRSSVATRGPVWELRLRVPRLRGVTVSGAVDLKLDDRSDAALFLDLSGTGSVVAKGAVPLLRVTTSGGVSADLTALSATIARAHAREHSRLAIRARDSLTIVALDSARVSYAARTVHLTARGSSILTRL